MTFKITSVQHLDDALAYARGSADFNADLEVEIQTDKASGKLLPCRGCKRPLVVNAFYAPARCSCTKCDLPRQHAALLNGGSGGGAKVVPAELLQETKRRYPSCKCGSLGLRAGMEVAQLIDLEAGCTATRHGGGGWVCARLDMVRRRCGV